MEEKELKIIYKWISQNYELKELEEKNGLKILLDLLLEIEETEND